MRSLFWSLKFRLLSKRAIREQLAAQVGARYRRALLTHFGARIGAETRLEHAIAVINVGKDYSGLSLGGNVFVGHNVLFDLKDRIEIGNNVTLSMNVQLTTHLDMGKIPLAKLYPPRRGPIRILDDVYVGAGAILLHGVTVGPHAVIAAGAVVHRDVGMGEVVGGVPARTIKRVDTSTL